MTTTCPLTTDSTWQVPLLSDSQTQGCGRGSTFELLQAAAIVPFWRALMKWAGKACRLLLKLLCYRRTRNSENTNMAVFIHPMCSSKEMLKSYMSLWTAELMTSDLTQSFLVQDDSSTKHEFFLAEASMSSPSCPHAGSDWHGALPAAFHSMGSLPRTLFHLLPTFEKKHSIFKTRFSFREFLVPKYLRRVWSRQTNR